MDASQLVLLDEELVQNLMDMKRKCFELLQQFKSISEPSRPDPNIKKFTSFEQFVNFVVNQEEILSSEL